MRRFQAQSPYKTISSDSQTHHGTTNKKSKPRQKNKQRYNYKRQAYGEDLANYQVNDQQQSEKQQLPASQFQPRTKQQKVVRNYHINSMDQQITGLKHQKAWYMGKQRYRSASWTDKKLKKVLGKAKLDCLKMMSVDHIRQKKQIKERHRLEMMKFNRWWTGYFQYLKERERCQHAKWQRQQEFQYEYLRNSLTKKYHSMRPHSRQLLDLEKQKKGLQKLQKFEDLHLLKLQKKKIKRKLQKQKNQQFMRIVQAQDQKFKRIQTKRYNSLMMRLQDEKKDAKRRYNRDQLRLKQKYKNVMGQLNHEQTIQINHFLGRSIA